MTFSINGYRDFLLRTMVMARRSYSNMILTYATFAFVLVLFKSETEM
jgi:hypothetical protein